MEGIDRLIAEQSECSNSLRVVRQEVRPYDLLSNVAGTMTTIPSTPQLYPRKSRRTTMATRSPGWRLPNSQNWLAVESDKDSQDRIIALLNSIFAELAALIDQHGEGFLRVLGNLHIDEQERMAWLRRVVRRASRHLADKALFARLCKTMHAFMRKMADESHFVLFLDEANTLSPARLMEFRRLFGPQSGTTSTWPLPPRVWLVMLETSSQLTAIAPVPGESGTERTDTKRFVHFAPFTALDIGKGPERIEDIGELQHMAKFGRPQSSTPIGSTLNQAHRILQVSKGV